MYRDSVHPRPHSADVSRKCTAGTSVHQSLRSTSQALEIDATHNALRYSSMGDFRPCNYLEIAFIVIAVQLLSGNLSFI